jgi:hypothetical protein
MGPASPWCGRVTMAARGWQTGAMPNRSLRHRTWFPTRAPQTLQFSVALLYWNAAIALLFGLLAGGLGRLGLVLIAGDVAGGYGVANERRWGYWTAVATAVLTLALMFAAGVESIGIISLLFGILLVVLLLHPMSRNYYRLWFR